MIQVLPPNAIYFGIIILKMLELLSLVSPLLILNVITCLFKSKQKVQHIVKLQETCTEMFTLPLKAFKSLNHSSRSIAQTTCCPKVSHPFLYVLISLILEGQCVHSPDRQSVCETR